MKGLLRVYGTFDLTQFWPGGESDADTAKVMVKRIEFSSDPAAHVPFKPITIFDHAFVKGASAQPKAPISKGKITVRLQGVDAKELHYAAIVRKKGLKGAGKRYRQHLGETATAKLHDYLFGLAHRNILDCQVESYVDKPNDVFDTYGRMIGDIIVTAGKKNINVNHWLLENGWAEPAFYNSMSVPEINTLQACADKALHPQRIGIWKHISNDAVHPDLSLLYRLHGQPDPRADVGPAVMPKIFRRQVCYSVQHLNHLFSGAIPEYLAKQKDGWVKTKDFMRNPQLKPSAKSKNLGLLVNKKGEFTAGPGDIVFFEKNSTLVNARNKPINAWS